MNKTMLAILRALEESPDGRLGSREISKRLSEHGIDLNERTVRYHMRILDERGYTNCTGRMGRVITPLGSREFCRAQVTSKLGFINKKIENLMCRVSFDPEESKGEVILNFTFFPKDRTADALEIMRPVFGSRLCLSDRVIMVGGGESFEGVRVPIGMAGFGTVCSITVNGIFLKCGIPVQSLYGGVLALEDGEPNRFTALISYSGTSLDPLELFIKSGMTDVSSAVRYGGGSILASFREIPSVALEKAEVLEARLKKTGFNGILALGRPNTELFEVPVGDDRAGMVLIGGLNPIAILEENGIPTVSAAMSAMIDFSELTPFSKL